MDMKIAGSGRIGAGEYDEVKVSGAGVVDGRLRCKILHVSGSVRCAGAVEVLNDVHVSGAAHMDEELRADSFHVSGGATIGGNCIVHNDIKASGGIRCEGNMKANIICISGSGYAANIEAEEINVGGAIVCPGLMNAENISIYISGENSEVGCIGGSNIDIGRDDDKSRSISKKFLFFAVKKKDRGHLTVSDSIEGDRISLDHVKANAVVGRVVKIGPGCKIQRVQYSESVEIDPDADVGEQIKI